MKILVADKFEQPGLERLRPLCHDLAYEPDVAGDALKERLAAFDPDLLIVRSTKVPDDVMASARKLNGIIRAGSGTDNIDCQAASRRGIMVANCPGMNAHAVAELTIGLMVALDRRIPDNAADLRAGRWNKKRYSAAGLGLKGRTLGIVGAGGIGTLVARAALAMDMHVLYYHLGRHRRLADLPHARRAELDDLLRESDVVSVHIPGGASTTNLIHAERVRLLKPTALVINTARAGIIDEDALYAALKEGRVRGAAFDVYTDEPSPTDKEIRTRFAELPNFIGTHHIGASTEQAQEAVALETVRLVSEFKQRGVLPNCVNMREPSTNAMLVVRMRNKPGSLAHVFQVISEAAINAEEMDHFIYDGGEAACAHIRVNKLPDEAVVARIREGHEHVIGVEVVQVE